MRALVLGAYGLIGKAVSEHLFRSGLKVTGLARSGRKGRTLVPEIDWLSADISQLVTPEAWNPFLKDIDVVVNAAGALQNSFKDRLGAVQRDAIIALGDACERAGVKRLIQISAPGAEQTASTEFLRTKAEADTALLQSSLNVVVLKPGLVIAPTAYGGTALLRMLSAFPMVQPMVLADTKVQTVWIGDLVLAVEKSVQGDVPKGTYELGETNGQSLKETILKMRGWLGFAVPRAVIRLPTWFGYFLGRFADLAGWFGWRSPLRTTALKVLEKGVVTDPSNWQRIGGSPMRPLEDTLRQMPSTAQERVYARAQLAFPIILLMLSVFWIASGIIGFLRHDVATEVLRPQFSAALSSAFVMSGSVVDVLIGLGLLVRRWVRPAAILSILVALGYMLAGTVFTPQLWLDPLGPFVKILPAIAAGLCVAALAEER